jgi:hypothetical protein
MTSQPSRIRTWEPPVPLQGPFTITKLQYSGVLARLNSKWHIGLEKALGDTVGKPLHCMLCGKEKFDPEAFDSQDFYLCWNCSIFWFTDYMRRLKAHVIAMFPWNWP